MLTPTAQKCEVGEAGIRHIRYFADGLYAETCFTVLRAGVWERRDLIRNEGSQPARLTGVSSRFDLERGVYELYTQAGGWCTESQGDWESLAHGRRVLVCEHGRTSQGSTPFLGIRCAGNDCGVAFHLLPRGNWRIEIDAHRDAGWRAGNLTLRFGPDDADGLRVSLQPGEEYALPSLLLVGFASARIESAAPLLHAATAAWALPLPKPPPVVYNTWLDNFVELDLDRLHRQVTAAAEVGCEVFVVDAGWYGEGEGWACQGDWREKTDRAFHGRMVDFADHVRASGLGFGLWMEPEAVHANTPLGKNPPRWLRPGPTGMLWPDLTEAAAYDWLRDEMTRLLDTYQAVWMKIDFNQPLGADPQRRGLRGYYDAWYRLLAELRGRFPDTFFENCASGAMRLELESCQHFHGHFLSDTVHPVDTIRIMQGTLLRVPPGGLYSWAVLSPAGAAPCYPHPADNAPARALTPCDATWKRAEIVDVGFAMAAALPGIPGLSGDLAGLAPELRGEIARWLCLWKQHRTWLRHSQGHLLTPVRPLHDNTGWAAFEFASADEALVLAFRLNDLNPNFRTQLR
ncbi:MAG: alpha-galactosidase, partial [Lentisphaeria bacterium]|nr:alpha-galactosidase [Lentisphaeria bacterium]